MIACPLCRAVNESGPNCRRCRADLSLLFTVDRQRDAALAAALQALAGGRLDDARRRLEQAEAIRPGGAGGHVSRAAYNVPGHNRQDTSGCCCGKKTASADLSF